MAVAALQPVYSEGQFLGADDLTALVAYCRTTIARQTLSARSWGIASGLPMVLTEIAPGEFQAAIGPGAAIDGYGRLVVLTEPMDVPPEKLLTEPTGLVRIWIRYAARGIRGSRAGYGTCDEEDAFERIEESAEIEVGDLPSLLDRQSGVTVAGVPVPDAREAPRAGVPDGPLHCDGTVPYQEMPVDDEESVWLIPVGVVAWNAVSQTVAPPTPEQRIEGRLFRRSFGAVAEDILAADGLLRLRDRASPFEVDVNAVCAARATTEADFLVCDEVMRARELIWLEGDTRLTGDLRLFGSRLEFRDDAGRDYVARAGQSAIDPLFVERASNAGGGSDLRVALGPRTSGPNRFTVGPARVAGTTLCDLTLGAEAHFVIDEAGRVGIGTGQPPETALSAPLTIRGVEGTATVTDPVTGQPTEVPVWPILRAEDAAGVAQWEAALWTDGRALALNRPGVLDNALHVAANGNVSLGADAPAARFEIRDVPTAPSGGLGNNLWFRLGDPSETGDGGRVWIEYGAQAAPLLVMSDHDDPPRMQFQQTGAGGDELAPARATWIGHLDGGSDDFGIVGDGRIGLRTEDPFTDVTIAGTLGFAAGTGPLVQMFPGGVGNPDRMVLSHSPGFAGWGLAYRDLGDRFDFQQSDGDVVMSVGLGTRRVGIGTDAPAAALDVRGSVRLGPAGTLSALGTESDMRAVAGQVSPAGGVLRGAGFLPVHTDVGRYTIAFQPPFAAPPVVTASPVDDIDTAVSISNVAAGSVQISCYDTLTGNGGDEGFDDVGFTFIAMGAR